MDWIQTFTGRKFHPLRPRVEDVAIEDIAHALAMQCRFNGHCRVFYSVAEHSVRCCDLVMRRGGSNLLAMGALLHDAGEAYLTDLPRPVKAQFRQFSAWEDRVLSVVLERFGLPADAKMPPEVKRADDDLLATEARDLMCEPPEVWSFGGTALDQRIEPVPPEVAERMFLKRFAELASRLDDKIAHR